MNLEQPMPFSPERPLRLGGRGSRLSLAMAEIAAAAITAVYPRLGEAGAIEYVVIKTSGDATQVHGDIPLAAFGSKELWTKEVETALAQDRIDIGLHCVKDVPSEIDPAFSLAAVLERGDARDCWISNDGTTLDSAPAGQVIGTSSPRRNGIILAKRPDLKIVPFRGNIDRRLEKLRDSQAGAIILAQVGLDRIRIDAPGATILSADEMLPACGQGALCFETLANNALLADFLQPINHAPSYAEITAERAMLQCLGGDCHTPIAAYAQAAGDRLILRGLVVRPDGTGLTEGSETGPIGDPVALGCRLGEKLRKDAPQDIFPQNHRGAATRHPA